MLGFSAIEAARKRIDGAIRQTPCARSEHLSRHTGVDTWLKLENVQLTGAFKERGALNQMLLLSNDSGGNIDVNVISRIIERGLIKEGRRVRLTARVLDQPGSLARMLTIVAEHRANVVEVSHTRVYEAGRIGVTETDLDLETRGHEHAQEILKAIRAIGCDVEEKRLERGSRSGGGNP